MNDVDDSMDPDRNPVDVLAEEFSERCRRGERPSINEYADKFPELADQIRRLFPAIATMEQVGSAHNREQLVAQSRTNRVTPRIEQVGDYRIVREIGRGGMGIVYEAVQESLGRRVAVKLLARQATLDEKHIQRFHREARTAARLHHTNIVPVFGVGEQDGHHYFVMQLIPGVGLDEVLAAVKHDSQAQGANGPDGIGPLSTIASRSDRVANVVKALHSGAFCAARQPGSSTSLHDSADHDGIGPSAASRRPGNNGPTQDSGQHTPSAGDSTQQNDALTQVAERWNQADSLGNSNEDRPDVDNGHPIAIQVNTRHAAETEHGASSGSGTTANKSADYWKNVARIGLQVADALAYAHDHGTLHRDIKPANLLLDTDGVVWVADFGLAKAFAHDDVSQTGDVVGTLRYMAPEQLDGEADRRSDIYSLGLTLYEALALQPAFDDGSRSNLLMRRGKGSQLASLRKLEPRIPRDLETIVLKAAAHEPAHRYQSAGELAADLHAYLEGRPIQARRTTSAERFFRWCVRNPAIASLSGVAALLLITVAVTTTFGYISTNTALAEKEEQWSRAERERQKALATLGISLEALDRVYRRFAPDRLSERRQLTLTNDDGEEVDYPVEPVLSQETAELLEDILSVYDRFAQEYSENLKLRAEAAKANRRIGDIQQQLGNYDRAEIAYRNAIQQYLDLSTAADNEGRDRDPHRYAIEVARIHNQLGNVFRAWQRPEESIASFMTALQTLESSESDVTQSNDGRFELARTYYLLAKRPPPESGPPPGQAPHGGGPPPPPPTGPGFGPPGPPGPPGPQGRHRGGPPGMGHPLPHAAAYIDEAIALLQDPEFESDKYPTFQYLLALCYRERSRTPLSDDMLAAIDTLERLSNSKYRIAHYRYELSETYAALDPRSMPVSELRIAEERLRAALDYADALVTEHPNIPEYEHSRAHTNFKLGLALRRIVHELNPADRDTLSRQAKGYCRDAIRIQQSLVERYADATPYRMELAKMQHALAVTLHRDHKPRVALIEVEASVKELERILETDSTFPFVRPALGAHYRTMAIILQKLDDFDGAREATELADSYHPMPRRRPARPGRGGFPGRPGRP